MSTVATVRNLLTSERICVCVMTVCLIACSAARGASQSGQSAAQNQPSNAASPVVLDRVVAVVNNRAILFSDVEDEIRLSILDPVRGGQGPLTEQHALEELISRALIEQQIRQEDLQAIEPSQQDVNTRLEDLRKQLPACIRQNCASDAGWAVFLASHGLTVERVEAYARYRVEILRFIEQRFRQGIQISQQQIEDYYHNTLLPQYAPGEAVPSLEQVASRIQEILLQQQVNVLFDNWLDNLRQQGDVEVLDPKLAPALNDLSAPREPGRGDP
ncbi:SurA domain protein [Candidatus Sulfotelmatomonas gaucii]|uniref:SurA domain protein n=1 Tax=Candidatus Sulfuritelmatomonas gaucii TaxID=2043161 RepID=A0A2N9L298_9BACT|nr:SurA domain protein [Candidatus Sulfotelmatomonas gaucii]